MSELTLTNPTMPFTRPLTPGTKTNMPTGPLPYPKGKRRFSTNSLEGQRGTLRTTNYTLHGDLSLRDRIHHFTLAWFTCTMSTGGIALLLSQTPHKFRGLTTIGHIIQILDIVLFVLFSAIICVRFVTFPKTLAKCLSHPTESLFLPTFFISIVNVLSNIQVWGVPRTGVWLVVTLRVAFWIYLALVFVVAIAQYFFLFTGVPLTLQSMTPSWILPIFPIMLCGTMAGLMSPSQPPSFALPIIIAGITAQGLGMMMSSFMYGPYIARLFTHGLPYPNLRPGMFITVGPPSFTGLALLSISKDLTRLYPLSFTISGIQNPSLIPDVLRLIALATAIFLWATAAFFFATALVAVIHGAWFSKPGMSFHLVWWSFVFPNVGFTICTIEIGEALGSEGILWVASAMTVVLVLVWMLVGAAHVRAVWRREILWPGKDEDHDQ